MSEARDIEHAEVFRRFKPYSAYKDSGVEWLGQVPAHWEVNRLRSTVMSVQNGVWGDEPDGVHDIACVRVADFDRVTLRVEMPDPTLRSIEPVVVVARGLHAGDLLLEKSGGGENQPVGAVVLYDQDLPAVCSNFIARVAVADAYSPRFLAYLHAALYARRVNVRHIKQSTGIQNLDSSSYFREATGLPPLPEQRAIAAFLDRETARIDALVAKKEQLVGLLQEQRNALITSAVTKGLDPHVPMRDSGVEWLGEIPAHWEVTTLAALTPPSRRITYGIVQPGDLDPDGIPMVRGQDYSTGWKAIETIFRVSPEIEAPYRRSRLRSGDLVMTIVGAGIGDIAITPTWLDSANLSRTNARIAISPRRDAAKYFYYVLVSDVGKAAIDYVVKGSAQPGINLAHIEKFKVPRPESIEETAIATFLDRETARIDALLAKVRDVIGRLKELRTALISAAVTGKIDVRQEVA